MKPQAFNTVPYTDRNGRIRETPRIVEIREYDLRLSENGHIWRIQKSGTPSVIDCGRSQCTICRPFRQAAQPRYTITLANAKNNKAGS